MIFSRDNLNVGLIAAVVIIIVIGFAVLFAATPERSAAKLRDAGYTNVSMGDRAYISAWACGKGVHYEYTATNPAGQRVKGIVCYPNFLKTVTNEEKL